MSQQISESTLSQEVRLISSKLNDLELEGRRQYNNIDCYADGASCYFVQIDKISSDKESHSTLPLENVLSIFRNLPARMIYLIKSDGKNTNFYLGVRSKSSGSGSFKNDYIDMIDHALTGNFRGSIVHSQSKVTDSLLNSSFRFSSVLGLPSFASSHEEVDLQSVDKVIHAMSGNPFSILITWESVDEAELNDIEVTLRQIFDKVSPLASYSKNSSESNSEGSHQSNNQEKSSSGSDSNHSESLGFNQNLFFKQYIDLQKSIDEEQMPRLKLGRAKGLYSTAIYLGATSDSDLALLESSFTSVFQSEKPSFAPLTTKRLPYNLNTNQFVANACINSSLTTNAAWIALKSRSLKNGYTSLGTLLTIKELSLMASFPRSDVMGLEVSNCISFGLNQPEEIIKNQENKISLGKILQDGGETDQPLFLPLSDLERHVFVAGTTGSGKTTTCHRLLSEANCPFLVIEPAKTEYRVLIKSPLMKHIKIFTVGAEGDVPFRLNPFEFLPSENISSHIDTLKACFMSSFEMEAAMPNLLEEAMYRIYEQFGWDISTNQNRYLDDRLIAWHEDFRGCCFPTIDDYIEIVEQVIKEKDFGDRLGSEYSGSLLARLTSFRTGVKGQILNTRRSIDFNWLIEQQAVIELEELRSGEDKSFLMALIVTRLIEAIKARFKEDQLKPSSEKFTHILLIEEAHRLLSRVDFGTSPSKKLGVEILSDMLAEVRKYHQSLIIVDQIPSKLTPDVLKNTNTKIVHRLFSEDDKQAIADAIDLSDKQKNFISRLNIGETIISGNGWSKPIHTKIIMNIETNQSVNDDDAFNDGRLYWRLNYKLFCPYYPKDAPKNPQMDMLQEMHRMSCMVQRVFSGLISQSVDLEQWKVFLEKNCSQFKGSMRSMILNVVADSLLILEMRIARFFESFNLFETYQKYRNIALTLVPEKFDENYKDDMQRALRRFIKSKH